MERIEYTLAIAAGFFTAFLLGWHGYDGYGSDWVYGFLAVFWSLLMMMRLMSLTTPADVPDTVGNLAQKLVQNLRIKQEEYRQAVLQNAFGGSFVLFLSALFLFAAWQIFCAAFPADTSAMESIGQSMQQLFQTGEIPTNFTFLRLFDWGQGFLLLLSLCMMGFVLRSHAVQRGMTRSMLLVLCGYAVAGLIAFAGLDATKMGPSVLTADLIGNGSGALSYMMGSFPADKAISLFDLLLIESGVGGLSILTFVFFVPLGYIALSASSSLTDKLVVTCGVLTGLVMILAMFLPLTPALGGFIALCWMGLFLAWGASENTLEALPA